MARWLYGFLVFSVFAFGVTPDTYGQSVYTLGSGDKVRVTVFGEEDLSGEFEVSGAGVVSLPLIGAVPAQGNSIKQLEDLVEAKLADGYLRNPRVTIEVLNYRPFYVMGEVKEPGSYPYVSGMTVLNAVALAGGFTYRADEDDIRLIRSSDRSERERTVGLNAVVLPGDVVRVEERFF